MILNDELQIEQTMRSSIQEMEVLYWMLEDAIYEGNNKKGKALLTMMLYAAKYRPELIQKGLKKPFRERLKEMSHDFFGNGAKRQQEAITMKAAANAKKIPFKLESELKTYLVDHKEKLDEAFKDKVRILGTEIITDGGYKCDIVAESKDCFYPIELKIRQGDHAVVSQCSKYCYYFYRQLRFSRFREMQGIVILNGVDAWAINELRRIGHWVYLIIPDGKKDIRLQKIENP